MMDFLYTIDSTADEPIMLIGSFIGYDTEEGAGIMGDRFQRELMALDLMGKSRIQVWINSPGGVVTDGYAIYNSIIKSKTKVDTYCFGIAASIAAVIFQAGRKRIMCDYGILMYHNPFGGDDASLDKFRISIMQMICGRTQMTMDQCEEMMKQTTYLDAQEAYDKKLCDEIELSADYNKKRLAPASNNTKEFWREAGKILNKQLEQNTSDMSTNMLKTTLALGLTEGVPEDAIVKAINEVKDKAYTAEAQIVALNKKAKDDADAHKKKLDDMEEEIDSMKEELKKKKKEFDDLKTSHDAMETDKKAAEDAAKQVAAKNMVEGFAKIGKIKNETEVISKWTAKAVLDLEDTKALLEGLPLNKQAPTIQVENKLVEGELPTSAVALMAKNRAARIAARS